MWRRFVVSKAPVNQTDELPEFPVIPDTVARLLKTDDCPLSANIATSKGPEQSTDPRSCTSGANEQKGSEESRDLDGRETLATYGAEGTEGFCTVCQPGDSNVDLPSETTFPRPFRRGTEAVVPLHCMDNPTDARQATHGGAPAVQDEPALQEASLEAPGDMPPAESRTTVNGDSSAIVVDQSKLQEDIIVAEAILDLNSRSADSETFDVEKIPPSVMSNSVGFSPKWVPPRRQGGSLRRRAGSNTDVNDVSEGLAGKSSDRSASDAGSLEGSNIEQEKKHTIEIKGYNNTSGSHINQAVFSEEEQVGYSTAPLIVGAPSEIGNNEISAAATMEAPEDSGVLSHATEAEMTSFVEAQVLPDPSPGISCGIGGVDLGGSIPEGDGSNLHEPASLGGLEQHPTYEDEESSQVEISMGQPYEQGRSLKEPLTQDASLIPTPSLEDDPLNASIVDDTSDPTTAAAGQAIHSSGGSHPPSSLGIAPGLVGASGGKLGGSVPSVPISSRERDTLRLTRFLSFPNQVNERGSEVHLFDGLMSHNWHDIRLLNAGYYGIRLHNLNEAAWDSLYLGIGRMKAVAEFEVLPPPRELAEANKDDEGNFEHCGTNSAVGDPVLRKSGGGVPARPFSAPGVASVTLDISDPESHRILPGTTRKSPNSRLEPNENVLASPDVQQPVLSRSPPHSGSEEDGNHLASITTPPGSLDLSLETRAASTVTAALKATATDTPVVPQPSRPLATGHARLSSSIPTRSGDATLTEGSGGLCRPLDDTSAPTLSATRDLVGPSVKLVSETSLEKSGQADAILTSDNIEAASLRLASTSSGALDEEGDKNGAVDNCPDRFPRETTWRGNTNKHWPQGVLPGSEFPAPTTTQLYDRLRCRHQLAAHENLILSQSADRSTCHSSGPFVIEGTDLSWRRPAATERLVGAGGHSGPPTVVPCGLGFGSWPTLPSIIGSSPGELQDVVESKGQLVSKAQQEKVMYFFVREPNSVLKLQVYASLTLGMRLRCSYDLVYGGIPRTIPVNAYVPFLRPVSILCLDGGGILGISSLKILERLELEIQKEIGDPSARLVDCFDLIGGTSTGGIISLGLLSGLSIREMIHIWGSMSGRIFDGNRTLFSGIFFEGYDIARLKSALVESFGQRFLNTHSRPYCFVTTTDVKHNPYELYLLRNYSHYHLANNEHKGRSAIPVWAAAWATSAAPTYLKGPNPEELEKMGLIFHPEVQLCDGAMKANNPTMVALEEAARLAGRRLNQFIDKDLDVLVSIGTGQPTLKPTIERTGIVSTFQILANSAHLLTSATTVHRDVLHWLGDNVEKYFRFNVPGIGDIPLDSIDKSSHDIIIKATNDYLSDEKYYDIRRLVRKLAARWRRSSELLVNYSTPDPLEATRDA